MNGYTTMGQTGVQQREIDAVLRTDAYLAVLRQTLGAALVRAGQHLAGATRRDAFAQTAPATSILEIVG